MKNLKDIEDFKDLTDFLYNEYDKMSESFGISIASTEIIKFTEKSLKKYFELYDKPLYRSVKREIQLREAIDTMPHSFIWKFFHYDLWQRVKQELGLKKEKDIKEEKIKKEIKNTQSSFMPVVVNKAITPIVEDEEE